LTDIHNSAFAACLLSAQPVAGQVQAQCAIAGWHPHIHNSRMTSVVQVRFLFPVLPLFNAVAAAGLAHVWQLCRRQRSNNILWHVGASIAASMCLSIVLTALAASHFNYPGGTALQQLHAATQSRVSTDIMYCSAHDLVLITAEPTKNSLE
jgi:hypothetical protein